MDEETTAGSGAVAGQVERPVRPVSEACKLTDKLIADMAFAVLRAHNDDRLWRALTYDRGPYDVTTPSLALEHLARVFFGAGVAAAEGKAETMRITLEFIAEHFSSDWPDRCQINVQAARRALAVKA